MKNTETVLEVTSWTEWKKRFAECQVSAQRRGMLREGFLYTECANREEFSDKICSYLNYADGYVEKGPDRQRQINSGKPISEERTAFEVLCQCFFKDTRQQSYFDHSWQEHVLNKDIFEKIVYFFRTEDARHISNLHSGSEERHDVLAKKFLLDFCQCMLMLQHSPHANCSRVLDVEEEQEFYDLIDRNRLALVDILIALIGPRYLLSHKYNEIIDRDLLEHIRILAMSETLILPDYDNPQPCGFPNIARRPKTIREAVWKRSSLAQVLLVLETFKQEQDNYNELIMKQPNRIF